MASEVGRGDKLKLSQKAKYLFAMALYVLCDDWARAAIK